MPNCDRVLALGSWPDGHPAIDAWETVARTFGHEPERLENIAEAFSSITPETFVLLAFGLNVALKTVTRLLDVKASVMIYVPEGSRCLAPKAAIKLCEAGAATVFTDRADLFDFMRHRCERFFADKPLYRKIALPIEKQHGICAFLSSPFPPFGKDFLDAAEAAVEARGVRVGDPRLLHRGGTIAEKVEALIEEADFVVANLRLSKNGFNPNVWMEIGIARTAKKPVLPYRYLGDEEPVASNIQGIDYLEYCDSLDLAMQLYWGLSWLGEGEK